MSVNSSPFLLPRVIEVRSNPRQKSKRQTYQTFLGRGKQSIGIYNQDRPHLSSQLMTPNVTHHQQKIVD
jgi:hypothetical protein